MRLKGLDMATMDSVGGDVEAQEPSAKIRLPFVWLGGAHVLVMVWILGRWSVSGGLRPVVVPREDGPFTAAVLAQVLVAVSSLALLGLVAWKALSRRRVTFELSALLWWHMSFFGDPFANMLKVQNVYNAMHINVRSWGISIPGWQSAHPELQPEPILSAIPGAGTWSFIGMMVAALLIARLEARGISRLRAAGIAILVLFPVQTVLEVGAIRTGTAAYVQVIEELSIFSGSRYQTPVYCTFFWICNMVGLAVLKRSWDTRGKVASSSGLRCGALPRLVGIVGFGSFVYTLTWIIPMNVAAQFVDDPVLLPSYLQSGVCVNPGGALSERCAETEMR